MKKWKVEVAKLGKGEQLNSLLEDGWEPFSAFTVGGLSWVDTYIVLRRQDERSSQDVPEER